MNAAWSALAEPAPRLLEAAWARAGAGAIEAQRIGVLGPACSGDAAVTPCVADGTIARWLVMSWIGAHPDARDPLLAELWTIEETARATSLPTLVLRLAPLIGPQSPLLAQLAQRPALDARLERALVQPVFEADVVDSLSRWISGDAEWSGWYEVCGPDPVSVGELSALTRAGRLGPIEALPAWEPGRGVLRSQGLSEWEAWARATGIVPRSILASSQRVPA